VPQLGVGIVPAQGVIANELTAVTRRAFLSKVYVQLWKSAPMISALLANAQVASGGLSPITAPVQAWQMVQAQWTGYDGSFNQPGVSPGITNAEFNLKSMVIAIPFLGMEGLVQVDYAVVPLIEARMNDATNVAVATLSQALYNNYTNQMQMIGLPGAIDDGTFMPIFGGINRPTNAWWKSTYVNNATPVTPTRALMEQYIAQVAKVTGELPKMGLCGFGTFADLALDYLPNERYMITPGSNFGTGEAASMFRAVSVSGVPVYADPYCPEGTVYWINTDYLSLYIHERASFYFTGFESTLPQGSIGFLGAMITLLELVNVKPQCHGKVTNLGYLPI